MKPITWTVIMICTFLCAFAFKAAATFFIWILMLAYLNPLESTCFIGFISSWIFIIKSINNSLTIDNKTNL